MDKIFKNDKIMGIVALVTLALVIMIMVKGVKIRQDDKQNETPKE